MTGKSKVLPAEVIPPPKVDTIVEMKLTRRELIDTILTEQETELEQNLADAQKVANEFGVDEKAQTISAAWTKQAQDALQEQAADRIDAWKQITGQDEPTLNWSDSSISKSDDFKDYTKVSESFHELSWFSCPWPNISAGLTVSIGNIHDNYRNSRRPSRGAKKKTKTKPFFTSDIDAKLWIYPEPRLLKACPAYKEFIKLCRDFHKVAVPVNEASRELQEFQSMGKKAHAALVRAFLNESSEGQEISRRINETKKAMAAQLSARLGRQAQLTG